MIPTRRGGVNENLGRVPVLGALLAPWPPALVLCYLVPSLMMMSWVWLAEKSPKFVPTRQLLSMMWLPRLTCGPRFGTRPTLWTWQCRLGVSLASCMEGSRLLQCGPRLQVKIMELAWWLAFENNSGTIGVEMVMTSVKMFIAYFVRGIAILKALVTRGTTLMMFTLAPTTLKMLKARTVISSFGSHVSCPPTAALLHPRSPLKNLLSPLNGTSFAWLQRLMRFVFGMIHSLPGLVVCSKVLLSNLCERVPLLMTKSSGCGETALTLPKGQKPTNPMPSVSAGRAAAWRAVFLGANLLCGAWQKVQNLCLIGAEPLASLLVALLAHVALLFANLVQCRLVVLVSTCPCRLSARVPPSLSWSVVFTLHTSIAVMVPSWGLTPVVSMVKSLSL